MATVEIHICIDEVPREGGKGVVDRYVERQTVSTLRRVYQLSDSQADGVFGLQQAGLLY